jgi:hypothetical protein
MYKEPNDDQPLKPVADGGGKCTSDEDCGMGGVCKRHLCDCQNHNYTGPFCLVRKDNSFNTLLILPL